MAPLVPKLDTSSRVLQQEAVHSGVCGAEYRNGSWVHEPHMSAPYRLERDPASNPLIKGWGLAYRSFWGLCDTALDDHAPRRSVQYAWRPHACELLPFSADDFCRAARRHGHELLFVGDSLTGELYVSLLALLRGAVTHEAPMPQRMASRDDHGDHDWLHGMPIQEFNVEGIACLQPASIDSLKTWHQRGARGRHHPAPAPLKLRFLRNELLATNTRETESKFRHENPWVSGIDARKTLLVLQVTMWHVADRSLEEFARGFNRTVTEALARLLNPSQLVVFSSNVPACRDRADTVDAADAAADADDAPNAADEPVRQAVSHPAGHKWGWDRIAGHNRFAEELVVAAGSTFLDISSMLALRADGHMPVSSKGETDCSHWCLPGAYDIGAQLLYNALEGRLDSPLAPLRGQVKAPALPPGAHHHVPRARRLSARKRRPGHHSGPQTAHTSSQLIESQPE